MTLITILICLMLQRLLGIGVVLHQIDWFSPYLQWVKANLNKINANVQGLIQIIVAVLPILLLLTLLNYLLKNWLFGGVHFLLAVVILFYCLNAPDLKKQLENYFAAIGKQDDVDAHKYATEFLGYEAPQNKVETTQAIIQTIFLRSYEGVFAILFWYLLLGIVGAALYYLINLVYKYSTDPASSDAKLAEAVAEVRNALDWIPVRLLGITYALMGHFVAGFSYCLGRIKEGIHSSRELAISTGIAALDLKKKSLENSIISIIQVIDLINRSLILWIVVIAFFTISAWLS